MRQEARAINALSKVEILTQSWNDYGKANNAHLKHKVQRLL